MRVIPMPSPGSRAAGPHAARRGARFGRRGGGAAPLVAPAGSVAGTVTIGGTLTATVTAGSPAPTYQWQRGATIDGVGSYSNIAAATAATYAPVAADMGYSVRCALTNAHSTVYTNALRYYPGQIFRCVYDPKDAGGFVNNAGTDGGNDLTATGSPTHNATDANFANEPTETLSGTAQYWTKASASMGGAVSSLRMWIVVKIDTYAVNDIFVQYSTAGNDYRIRMTTGPVVQVTGSGTGAAVSTATTAIAGVKLIGGEIAMNGSQSAYYKTSAEDTDANTHADLVDAGTISIGASSAGASDAAITIGLVCLGPGPASASARADLGAYCTNRFGAGVGT